MKAFCSKHEVNIIQQREHQNFNNKAFMNDLQYTLLVELSHGCSTVTGITLQQSLAQIFNSNNNNNNNDNENNNYDNNNNTLF